MGELTRIINEAIADAKKEAQEALKKNLEVLLKEKYGITLTDEDLHTLYNPPAESAM
jgi:hypothetical protein